MLRLIVVYGSSCLVEPGSVQPSGDVETGDGYDRRIWLLIAGVLMVAVLVAIVFAARGDGSQSGPADMGGMNMSAPRTHTPVAG